MELPYNTVFSQQLKVIGNDEPGMEIADWPTKRAWVQYAYDTMTAAGYSISSAYTLVREKGAKFVYRDALWHGADMFGTGVASFGHIGGVHVQNVDRWEEYIAALDRDELPLGRALPITPHQALIREMVLQLKTGHVNRSYFQKKFGVDVRDEFAEGWRCLEADGKVTLVGKEIAVTAQGMLVVDRLLPTFFEPEHLGSRYT